MQLLITAGSPEESVDRIVVLDWTTKTIRDTFEYPRTPHQQGGHDAIGFRGASVNRHLLYTVNGNQIFVIDTNTWQPVKIFDSPRFNDLHFIYPKDDGFYLCNTGIDTVEKYSHDGDLLKVYDLVKFHPDYNPRTIEYTDDMDARLIDFRKHSIHSNHLFERDGRLYVTFCYPGQIVDLESGEIKLSGLGRPHDGLIVEDDYYVTQAIYQQFSVLRGANLSMNTLDQMKMQSFMVDTLEEDKRVGWVRGLCVLEDTILVAITRWKYEGDDNDFLPTRILTLDKETLALLDEWTVPKEIGARLYTLMDVSHLPRYQHVTESDAKPRQTYSRNAKSYALPIRMRAGKPSLKGWHLNFFPQDQSVPRTMSFNVTDKGLEVNHPAEALEKSLSLLSPKRHFIPITHDSLYELRFEATTTEAMRIRPLVIQYDAQGAALPASEYSLLHYHPGRTTEVVLPLILSPQAKKFQVQLKIYGPGTCTLHRLAVQSRKQLSSCFFGSVRRFFQNLFTPKTPMPQTTIGPTLQCALPSAPPTPPRPADAEKVLTGATKG